MMGQTTTPEAFEPTAFASTGAPDKLKIIGAYLFGGAMLGVALCAALFLLAFMTDGRSGPQLNGNIYRVADDAPQRILAKTDLHLREMMPAGALADILAYAGADRGLRFDAGALAANAGRRDVAQALLADRTYPIDREWMLVVAAEAGHREIVQLLLDHGVHANADGALRFALANGRAEIVRLLLERGANATNPSLNRALDKARRAGHLEAANLVVTARAQAPNGELRFLFGSGAALLICALGLARARQKREAALGAS
jgi:hypothetical protein